MYATIADLIARYGAEYLASLTNTDPSNNVPDNAALALALEEACAEVDMYLGKCFDIPTVAPFPPILKFKTLILARYYLESGCDCSEKTQKQYDSTIEWLHSLCCGDCPPVIPGLTKSANRADGIAWCSLERVFDRSNLGGYRDGWGRYGGRYGGGYANDLYRLSLIHI